ncbi:hypothetical protein H0H81_009275 [Sphagnurus paluster]|uniref:RING-type domain-containing protein n=1 Tax=Sphagnurus paluster TaxID=117069 RepID=A0A9P7GPL1_9AGAR|nr:hypothetical protein H0H81_009275 [Sphagnurus paluster]
MNTTLLGDQAESLNTRALKSAKERALVHTYHILRIHPNVDRDQLHSLVVKNIDLHEDAIVELALAAVNEGRICMKPGPNNSGSAKRKHSDSDDEHSASYPERASNKRSKVDYSSIRRPFRGGRHYFDLAFNQLRTDFPDVPRDYIETILKKHKSFYAPSHLALIDEYNHYQDKPLPYVPRVTPFTRKKGKGRELHDDEFKKEREWLLQEISGRQEHEAEVECSCCYSTFPSDKEMISCHENHIFCETCVASHAENLIAVHKAVIKCMSTDDCDATFSADALRKSLPPKSMALWERLNQRREIEAAGVQLDNCPFCDWGCVIDDERVTILNHYPQTCEEAEEEKKLQGQHAIDEAMTNALMRKCPHCGKAFVKEDGVAQAAAETMETLQRNNPDFKAGDLKVILPEYQPPRPAPPQIQMRGRIRPARRRIVRAPPPDVQPPGAPRLLPATLPAQQQPLAMPGPNPFPFLPPLVPPFQPGNQEQPANPPPPFNVGYNNGLQPYFYPPFLPLSLAPANMNPFLPLQLAMPVTMHVPMPMHAPMPMHTPMPINLEALVMPPQKLNHPLQDVPLPLPETPPPPAPLTQQIQQNALTQLFVQQQLMRYQALPPPPPAEQAQQAQLLIQQQAQLMQYQMNWNWMAGMQNPPFMPTHPQAYAYRNPLLAMAPARFGIQDDHQNHGND